MTNAISTRLETGRWRRKDGRKSPETVLNAVVLVQVERVVFVNSTPDSPLDAIGDGKEKKVGPGVYQTHSRP